MNTDHRSDQPRRDQDSIGDHNIERLLSSAYQPESLDPDFVARVRERAQNEFQRRQNSRGPILALADRLVHSRRWQTIAATVAGMLVMTTIYFLVRDNGHDVGFYRDGSYVWIEGIPYIRSSSTDLATSNNRKSAGPQLKPAARHTMAPQIHGGLVARERNDSAPPKRLVAGATVKTLTGKPRHVTLPDGSQLYIAENTSVEVVGDRELAVDRGSVFIDVAPLDNGDSRPTFLVSTPDRDVSAWGTKFAVNVGDEGTGVLVTQGKVQVSGIEPMILAGQQLHPGPADEPDKPRIAPLPRASYVLNWMRDLVVDSESPLIPRSEYGGGALLAIDPHGQQTKLSLRKYHIDVHIEDGFARTTIDQTYFNHWPSRMEGTFYFPLPSDASISRLAMYVNGHLMEGGMAEREHARNVFETIKHRRLDPALLEWIDGSTFKMRVFPLEGRQEKRIILSYTQKLDNSYGRTDYRFPAGHNMDRVRNWSVKLHVVDGAALKWKCSSHELTAATENEGLTLTRSATNIKPNRDIVVSLGEEKDLGENGVTPARFSVTEHEDWRYLMMQWRPELTAEAHQQRRDWVFLLDADGSRDPLLARVQVDVVRTMLENAGHDDTFSILTAGTRIRAFKAEQQRATPENVAAAVEFLNATHLIGALDLKQALTSARGFAQACESPMLVHVGAGFPILGERNTDKLLKELPQDTPYVGIAVGKRWNRNLMRGAAARSGGFFTQINPDESTQWRTLELLSTLNTPRLLDAQVAADREQCEFLLVNKNLAHGDELCAITRLKADEPKIPSVTVTGIVSKDQLRRQLAVGEAEEGADYLPRMWAKLAIDEMVTRDAQANKDEIIELSKSMYVMSPFTSLLVLENDAMYDQYDVDRGRKDHWALYPCPEKIDVVREPMNDRHQGAGPDESGTAPAKPSPAEVLRTLMMHTPDRTGSRMAAPHMATQWGRHFDSGTVIFGDGVQHGIPLLSKLPYTNSLFRRDFSSDQTMPLSMMLAPRVIIQEEEDLVISSLTDFDEDILEFLDRSVRLDVDVNGSETLADFDSLLGLITSSIEPNTWIDVGGRGTIRGFPSDLSLVVSQAQSLNDGSVRFLPVRYPVTDLVLPIRRFEDYARFGQSMQGLERSAIPFPIEPPILYPDPFLWEQLTNGRVRYRFADAAPPSTDADRQILVKLNERSNFIYSNATIHQVLDDLRTRLSIPISLRAETVAQSKTNVESKRLTISVQDLKIRPALRLILDKFDLTYFMENAALHVTTPSDAQEHLALRSRWLDETLILFGVHPKADVHHPGRSNRAGAADTGYRDRIVDTWSRRMLARRSHNQTDLDLLYPTLHASSAHAFRNLAAFAPGFTTTLPDVLSVLNSEAQAVKSTRAGVIEEGVKALIDTARGSGWISVTRPGIRIVVDGQGRFQYQHKTEYGLYETVVCDGKTLKHLYPELGIGTTRTVSRFHRRGLMGLVPWFLPPAEDLVVGADLRLIGPRTVAVVPHGTNDGKDGNNRPKSHRRVHLLFAPDGRLAERHVVELPSGKVITRTVFKQDGPIRYFQGKDTLVCEFECSVEKAAPPEMTPDVRSLVLLPMPIRSRDHIFETVRNARSEPNDIPTEPNALKKIVSDQKRVAQDDPVHWAEEDVLRLVAACLWHDPAELRSVIGRRYFARGDRRIGFYTLLLSGGDVWSLRQPVQLSENATTRMNPVQDHPTSRLARYIHRELEAVQNRPADTRGKTPLDNNPFIEQLTEYRKLCSEWSAVRELTSDVEVRRRSLDELFQFVARCDSPRCAYVLLRRVQRRLGNDQPHGRIAEAIIQLEETGVTSYVVKYELARSLAARGRKTQARDLFVDLYCQALEGGILPPLDRAFIEALKGHEQNPFDNETLTEKGFSGFMCAVANRLVQQDARPTVIALAWQCRQLEQAQVASRLFDLALVGPGEKQLITSLSALNYLLLVKDYDRALELFDPLLTHTELEKSSSLWQLVSQVAKDAGRLAQAVRCAEQALDLEYASMPEQYNVEVVRDRYQQLFDEYLQLARLTTVPGEAPRKHFVSRAIQAADRWRTLDSDVTQACQHASKFFAIVGLDDLAWDYLTTPLALKPNEATAWLELAQTLSGDKSHKLASRAYASAFDAEPTNAQILWDHAQMLGQAGRGDEAQTLYDQIARGQWQPRFQSLQQRAQSIVAAAKDE